jgi:hypothetical protein
MPTYNGTLYIHAPQFGSNEFEIYNADMSKHGLALLGTHDYSVDYENPTKDPVDAEIESLQKKADAIETKALADIEIINRRIRELKCIEYKPEVGS